jgi:hypothetical protein
MMNAARHPAGFRRGLVGERAAPLRKPLAEASGMTLAITIRALDQTRRPCSPRVTPPASAGGLRGSDQKAPGGSPGNPLRKPLAEASGMTLAIAIRALDQTRR